MPCIPVPVIPIPSLPDGINLLPKLPTATLPIPNACCLLPLPAVLKLAIPLPPLTVNAGLGSALKAAGKAARAWLANLQPTCPRQ